MSVAETPVRQRTQRSPVQQVAVGSFLGAVYVLLSLWLVFGGLPWIWTYLIYGPAGAEHAPVINEFLADALLIVADLTLAAGLIYLGALLMRNQTGRGLRAGIFVAAVWIFLALWIGVGLGHTLSRSELGTTVGAVVTLAIVLALLVGGGYLFMTRPVYDLLGGLEDQGWFTLTPYKGNQGVRIRRATIMGALIIGFSGIITLVTHRSFGSERLGANDWQWTIPFTEQKANPEKILERYANDAATAQDKELVREKLSEADRKLATEGSADQIRTALGDHVNAWWTESRYVPLMYKVQVLIPIVLSILLFWFSYRLVHVPTFADFLIATEAEMNKVSWTTRRRLVQDTIVVLITVFLMTGFLFFIDILWIKVLSGVGVLQVNLREIQQKQQEKSQW